MIEQIDAQVANGVTLKDAVQAAGISDQTYYTWKKGVAQPAITIDDQRPAFDDELAEFDELEAENRRLRKLLSEKLRTENADLRKRLGLKDA